MPPKRSNLSEGRSAPRLLQLAIENAGRKTPSVRSQVAGDVATIYLYGVIDDLYGISAESVVREIATITAPELEICINSPGGDIFAARAIASAIKGYAGKTSACVDGLCASAATYIALAANEVEMAEGSFMMIHNSWTLAMGDSEDLLATAALLEKIDGTIAATYAAKCGKSVDEMRKLMADETWFTAQEAIDIGLADTIDTPAEDAQEGEGVAANAWALASYDHPPKALTEAPQPKTKPAQPDEEILQLRAANERRLKLLETCST